MTSSPASSAPLGTASNPRPRRGPALVGWLLLCYAVEGLGASLTAPQIPTWYRTLAKPALNPPDGLFPIVWTALYTMMAVAAWLAWRTRRSSCRTRGTRLFFVQLLLNLSWSWLFFTQHRTGLALVEIALLAAAIALTMQAFGKMSRAAFWLMAPYLAWVGFAAYLNEEIWRLNR